MVGARRNTRKRKHRTTLLAIRYIIEIMEFKNSSLIIIAGIILFCGFMYKHYSSRGPIDSTTQSSDVNLGSITEDELIIGNPDANYFLVEYIDLQCGYCKEFHPHLKNLSQDPIVTTGRVALVLRHGAHTDEIAREKAVTAECVRVKYGNNTAIDFIDKSIEVADEAKYPKDRYSRIFNQLELDEQYINKCRLPGSDVRQALLKKIFFTVNQLNITSTPYLQIQDDAGDVLFENSGVYTYEELKDIFAQLPL